MDRTLVSVILAGGKGERFWPLSRKSRPKQFLSLDGSGRTLLQSTADRLLPLSGNWDGLWVITAAPIADQVREQLPELPEENLLVEPEGRDTAPAVAWTAIEVAKRHGEEAVLGLFPADHWIGEPETYQKTLQAAATLARQQEVLVTLGIAPTYASTGYGYIEQGEPIGTFADLPAYRVNRFTEKPDRATAEEFLASGRFSWNSGMFLFRAGVVLAELATHAPEILQPLQTQGVGAYPSLTKKSIDYALMEKTQKACVFPVAFSWDDLGDWNAIERLLKGDHPNVELATHVGLDTQGTILYASDPEEVIVTIGLEDVVVVRDGKATLIVKKDRTQEIKKALELLKRDPQFQSLL
ncbi:mannose-1-phosphate guanylyltransferase [Leptolyngbya sp. 'hensonii']|uniref:mannose-1-phosphate guanylyltransferase n=1 Tax=Leptolyngbya sp. 'hensonii' TaxID=1922337 RepID=UPI00094FF07C|nr:mannose-1-phosphate guanylyltransferase [Leptolyngbya sp. 'hensonii']OLP18496.1 mannose-1-phosphate guanylyltransferase [Leptolyngbya sp. 'hensonii']